MSELESKKKKHEESISEIHEFYSAMRISFNKDTFKDTLCKFYGEEVSELNLLKKQIGAPQEYGVQEYYQKLNRWKFLSKALIRRTAISIVTNKKQSLDYTTGSASI